MINFKVVGSNVLIANKEGEGFSRVVPGDGQSHDMKFSKKDKVMPYLRMRFGRNNVYYNGHIVTDEMWNKLEEFEGKKPATNIIKQMEVSRRKIYPPQYRVRDLQNVEKLALLEEEERKDNIIYKLNRKKVLAHFFNNEFKTKIYDLEQTYEIFFEGVVRGDINRIVDTFKKLDGLTMFGEEFDGSCKLVIRKDYLFVDQDLQSYLNQIFLNNRMDLQTLLLKYNEEYEEPVKEAVN